MLIVKSFALRFVWAVQGIQNGFNKVKDYDRIAHDYSCVLDYATMGRMSKTNYDLKAIYAEIRTCLGLNVEEN